MQKYLAKKILTFLIITFSIFSITACGNQEEKARKLYNEALVIQRAGDVDKANELYSKIVDKYPSTEIAVKVNEMLAGQEFVTEVMDDTLKDAIKQSLETALESYRLDNGRYPTTEQGIKALIEESTIPPVPARWRHGGYMNIKSGINAVYSYTLDSNGYDYEIIMK